MDDENLDNFNDHINQLFNNLFYIKFLQQRLLDFQGFWLHAIFDFYDFD